MSCIVKYLGGFGNQLSLVLKGATYKFTPKSEKILDTSLGEIISRLPDKSLRSKFQVTFVDDPEPTLNIEQAPKKKEVSTKKKTYVPRNAEQRALT